MCANDFTAAKVMHTFLKLGIRIPEDVRIIGINDYKVSRVSACSTHRAPSVLPGNPHPVAMAVILDRLQRPSAPTRDVLLDCELIIRQSRGARV